MSPEPATPKPTWRCADHGPMERQLTRLETILERVQVDVAEIKAAIAGLSAEVKTLTVSAAKTETTSAARWGALGRGVALALGGAGLALTLAKLIGG